MWNLNISVWRRKWATLGDLVGAQAAVAVGGIIAGSLLARHFDKTTYGQYQTVVAWAGVVAPLCLTGLRETIKISAAKKYHGNIAAVVRYMAIGSAGSVIVLILIALGYRRENPVLAAGLITVAVLSPLMRLEALWVSYLTAVGALRRLARMRTIKALLGVLAALLLVLCGVQSLIPLIVVFVLVPATVGIWCMTTIWRNRTNDTRDPDSLRYGFHVSVVAALAGLVMSDRIILEATFQEAQVATWAIALILPTRVRMLVNLSTTYYSPQLYKTTSLQDCWNILRKQMGALLLLFVAIGVSGYFILPVAITIIFSGKYADAAPYASILWLVNCIVAPGSLFDIALRAHQKKAGLYGQMIAYPVLLLLLNLWLVRYGLAGVLTARVVADSLQCVWICSVFYCYMRRSAEEASHNSGAGLQ